MLLVGEVAVAVIEAKDNCHAMGNGMRQALAYAVVLHTPIVFACNGNGFVLHDRTKQIVEQETTLPLDAFHAAEYL